MLRTIAAVARTTVGSSNYGRFRDARHAPVREQHFAPLLTGQRVSAALAEALLDVTNRIACNPSLDSPEDPLVVARAAILGLCDSDCDSDGEGPPDPSEGPAVGRAIARLIAERLAPGAVGTWHLGPKFVEDVFRLARFLCQGPGRQAVAWELGSSPAALGAIAHQLARPGLPTGVLYGALSLLSQHVLGRPVEVCSPGRILKMSDANAAACSSAFSSEAGKAALQTLLRVATCRGSGVTELTAWFACSALKTLIAADFFAGRPTLALSALPSAPAALLASLRAATTALAGMDSGVPRGLGLSWCAATCQLVSAALLMGDVADSERWADSLARLGAGDALRRAGEACVLIPLLPHGQKENKDGRWAAVALGVFAARWSELIARQPERWSASDAGAADALQRKAAELLVQSRSWLHLSALAAEWPDVRGHLLSGALLADLCSAACCDSLGPVALGTLALVVREATPASTPLSPPVAAAYALGDTCCTDSRRFTAKVLLFGKPEQLPPAPPEVVRALMQHAVLHGSDDAAATAQAGIAHAADWVLEGSASAAGVGAGAVPAVADASAGTATVLDVWVRAMQEQVLSPLALAAREREAVATAAEGEITPPDGPDQVPAGGDCGASGSCALAEGAGGLRPLLHSAEHYEACGRELRVWADQQQQPRQPAMVAGGG